MECILVTGSAGFVGGHVLTHLTRDLGLNAVGTTRDGRPGSRRLDLRDPAGMQAALAGVSAVVHCAVGDRAVTVDGTAALLRAAAAAGVRRMVHISSVAVYGAATGTVREDAPLISADGHGYAAWKAAAEQACLAQCGVETVRLRPTIVYGAGGTLWVSRLARRIRSGRWGTFGTAGEGLCNLVHVADVAAAAAAAVTAPASGAAFNVNGPVAITWNQWFARLASAIGAPSLPSLSPLALQARSFASLPLKALARKRPGIAADWLLGAPASSELTLFALRATYPTDAARAGLGWAPSVGIDEGLADSVAWLRQEGLAA
jgi:nucleoside-diphosphate-sugar epimerase